MKKVLIVDDDTDILSNLKILLSRQGYETIGTTIGQDTLALTTFLHPDIILLDIQLGEVDGRDICKGLKDEPATNKVPIIMMSAHAGADDLKQECPAEGFMAKPFDMPLLYEKIAALTAA